MKLIYTNDGMIGLKYQPDSDVTWCSNKEEAISLAAGHYAKQFKNAFNLAEIKDEMRREIGYAIEDMSRKGHTIAEFGVFGSFMFSTTEPEYEF